MIAFLMVIEYEETRIRLEELYIMYRQEMYVIAYSILKDLQEAEDIVQEVILKLKDRIDDIKEVKSKKTRSFLLTITRNLAIDEYNKRKRLVQIEERIINENQMIFSEGIEDTIIRTENRKELFELLKKMNPAYADIISLRYFHEMSISEISEYLGISVNNVSVRLNRAVESLKTIMINGGVIIEKSV